MPTKHQKLNQEALDALQAKLATFDFTPEQLLVLVLIIGDVHKFISMAKDDITRQKHKDLLAKLLQYLISNKQLAVAHKALIAAIRLILGITLDQEHAAPSEELDEEAGLSTAERKRRYELAMYELYKILNPNRLAGETALDNFLHNVAVHGIDVARQYQGSQYETQFNANDLVKLASYRHSLGALLKEEGAKGFGRGM